MILVDRKYKIHTNKRETEKRKEIYQVGGLGGFVKPAQGMADQRQQAAASCQGQWLGGEAGPSPGMEGAPASASWMDGQQINKVGGATGPSQGMVSQGQ